MTAEETPPVDDMSMAQADDSIKTKTEFFHFDDDDVPVEEPEETDVADGQSESRHAGSSWRFFALCFVLGGGLLAFGVWFGMRAAAWQELVELEARLQSLQEHQRMSQAASVQASAGAGDPRTQSTPPVPQPARPPVSASAGPASAATVASTSVAGQPAVSATGAGEVAGEEENEYPDLSCNAVPYAEWHNFKRLAAQHLGAASAGVEALSDEMLRGLLTVATEGLQAMSDRINDCGMGRLCITLLGVLAGEAEDRSLLSAPSQVHSPLLTVLLDYPWVQVVQSGWPLFGILAQMHLRRRTMADLPADGGSATYYEELQVSLFHRQLDSLSETSAAYLKHQEEQEAAGGGGQGGVQVMPALCALACQLLGPQAAERGRMEVFLTNMQGFFKQVVLNIEDLQQTLDSSWPLYPILALAAARFQGHTLAPAAGGQSRASTPVAEATHAAAAVGP